MREFMDYTAFEQKLKDRNKFKVIETSCLDAHLQYAITQIFGYLLENRQNISI